MRPAAALAVLALVACAKEIPDPGGAEVDFSSPKSVVSHVFWAARTGNDALLASLCAPTSSRSVARVCATTRGSAEWDSFVWNFAKAHLNGEPRVTGEHAIQKFLYGPEGAEPDTMTLVRVDGKWLLESF